MWDTPRGPRKLGGRERAAFVAALLSLFDHLKDAYESGDDFPVAVHVFNEIPLRDRAMLLLRVGEDVLGDGAAPEIQAWSAGTVAAVYCHLEGMVELEIDGQNLEEEEGDNHLPDWGIPKCDPSSRFTWRTFVHEAWMELCFPDCEEIFPDGEGDRQTPDSEDLEEWTSKIESLAGEVLEDADYEMEEDFMDLSAPQAAGAKDWFGIQGDYFTTAPPFLSREERQELLRFRDALLRETEPRVG